MSVRRTVLMGVAAIVACAACIVAAGEEAWPALPEKDGSVAVAGQEWALRPGPRSVTVHIQYPREKLESVTRDTGLMLSLHNWGGVGFDGAPDPVVLAKRYNVIVIGVDYLQSGAYDPERDPPYDFGWIQALDALRGLYFVWHSLETMEKSFDHSRVYATGGSGGGNVALMANKLAPRTFACVIDLSGVAKLADDIAFGRPGRTRLDAGYRQDAGSERCLTPDAQALRFIGFPEHLSTMRQLGNTAKIVVVHGVEDDACPVEDVREMADNMRNAGLDIVPHFITKADVDGKLFKDCRHSLGNRTQILQHFADADLLPDVSTAARRAGKPDFECRDEAVRYKTPNGAFVISYTSGYPVGRFETEAGNASAKP